MSSSYGRPILIGTSSDAQILETVPLQKDAAREYSEDWLQNLLYRYPEALPISEIDRSFEGLIPVCRELSTPVGGIDVLYVTPQGRLAVVEATPDTPSVRTSSWCVTVAAFASGVDSAALPAASPQGWVMP